MSYLTLKTLHLFGVILFVGNIIVTAWWKVMADRTGDPKVIAFAQRQVILADYLFTTVGVLLVWVCGEWMARVHLNDGGSTPWLDWARGLFAAAVFIWLAVLVPVQARQARLARGFADGSPIPAAYRRLTRIWNLWGTLAVLLPLITFYWMVFKPT